MKINNIEMGQWEIEGQGQPVTGVLDVVHNHYICKITGWEQETQDKIAAFIAAAPELLEACKAFMSDPNVIKCKMVNLDFVKNAIAKAEGRDGLSSFKTGTRYAN